MQLKEILDENSVKSISQRTNISENNIEILNEEAFNRLKRVKTLGFISILEREYSVDLSRLRENALAFYDEEKEEESVTMGIPMPVEKRGRSKLFYIIVIALIGYASWYFFTKFDREQLKNLLPFKEHVTIPLDSSHANTNPEKLKIEEITMPEAKSSAAENAENTEKVSLQNETENSTEQDKNNTADSASD